MPEVTVHPEESLRAAAREMLRIAIPAVVTMLSYTVMQFVDMLIVSRLGSDALAAVGNGGVAAFVPAAAMFGIVGVIATFVSQHLGAGTPEKGSAYAWNGLWLSVLVWFVFFLPLALVMPHLFALMRGLLSLEAPAAVVAQESVYGRILLAGMILVIASRGLAHFFYGVHLARIVMVAAIVGNLINVPITYALVLGVWGAPELGVAGAAIGTIIGGLIEFAILFATFLSPAFDGPFKTRRAWRLDWSRIRDIWRIGWPAGVMFGNEVACWWIFMAGLIAHFGIAHNAAGWIVLRYMHLSFMPAVGMSMAITAVVGKSIGRKRIDLAIQRTWLGLGLTMGFMGLCAVAFVLFREPAVAVFANSDLVTGPADPALAEEIIRIGAQILIIAAAFQVFDAMAISLTGALRGAGDTVWPGVTAAVLSWVCIIGIGIAFKELAPGLGSIGPWIAAATYIILLSIFLLVRFLAGSWKRIDLLKADRCRLCGGAIAELPKGTPSCPHCGESLIPATVPCLAADAGEGIVPELPATDVPEADEPARV